MNVGDQLGKDRVTGAAVEAVEAVEPQRTKTDAVYQVLRCAIVTGDLGPDDPMDEGALRSRYGLGRTPLREALKRLANEQFLSWSPHSSPVVRSVAAHELADLYQARIVLEEPVSRIACERLSIAELDALEGLSQRIEECLVKRLIYEAVELDHHLHLAIAEGSGNRFLAQAINRLNCGSLRMWYVAHDRLRDQTETARHDGLIAALRRRDPDKAAEETRRHVLRSHERQMLLQGWGKTGEDAMIGALVQPVDRLELSK